MGKVARMVPVSVELEEFRGLVKSLKKRPGTQCGSCKLSQQNPALYAVVEGSLAAGDDAEAISRALRAKKNVEISALALKRHYANHVDR